MWWRTILASLLVCTALSAADEKPPSNQVDPAIYRAAMEKLAAKAATQPSELDRLKKENDELKRQIKKLEAELATLRPTKTAPALRAVGNDIEAIIKKAYAELNVPYAPARTLAEYDTQTKLGASQIRVENRGLYLEDEAAFNLIRKVERDIIVAEMKDNAIRDSRPKDAKN